MIPLRDHNTSKTTPFITYILLIINIAVFGLMYSQSTTALEQIINIYALIPRQITQGQDLFTLFTSMFMHGSLGHLIGNMLFLHIFGDNLEDTLGHFKYLSFYLISGLAASFLQIAINPTGTIPNLGASGAIAGLMGGYLLLFPKRPIDVLFTFGFAVRQVTLPAFTMLFYWIVFQFLSGFGTLAAVGPDGGGVAYFAHIGGFIAGLALVYPVRALNHSI